MTTSITSPFISALLAPIPAVEEQADTKQFRRLLTGDLRSAWFAGMARLRVAQAQYVVEMEAFRNSGERYITDNTPHARRVQMAISVREALNHKQCLLPAPRPVEMRWKKNLFRYSREIPAAIAAAITRDEARFSEGR